MCNVGNLLKKNFENVENFSNFAPLLRLSISIQRCIWAKKVNIKIPWDLCDGRLCKKQF